MHRPLISVLVPTYNRPDYLLLTLKSILSQSYDFLEIIICDNSDNDDTQKVINDFHDKSRILYSKNDTNIGVVNNFNKCLTLANGDYIHFLSDDDLLLPNALLNKVELIKATKAEFIFSKFSEIDANGNILNTQPWGHDYQSLLFDDSQKVLNLSFVAYEINRKVVFSDLYSRWNFICLSTVMISRKVFENTGIWDINLPIICDWDYWLRVTKNYEAFYIDENLVGYRRHNLNITSTQTNYKSLKNQLLIIKKNLNPEIGTGTIIKDIKKQIEFLKPRIFYLQVFNRVKKSIQNLFV